MEVVLAASVELVLAELVAAWVLVGVVSVQVMAEARLCPRRDDSSSCFHCTAHLI